jgi:hypothetical protein
VRRISVVIRPGVLREWLRPHAKAASRKAEPRGGSKNSSDVIFLLGEPKGAGAWRLLTHQIPALV